MTTRQREKILSYQRAEYFIENPDSIRLSSCIIEAICKGLSIEQSSILKSDGQYIRLAKSKIDAHKGVYLHLTIDTPGDTASVVPKVLPGEVEMQVSVIKAPEKAEFMDADAFIYVRGNDLCLCSTSMRIGSIKHFLHEFFIVAKIRRDASEFDLLNSLSAEKLTLMHKHGVKEIELHGSIYSATSEYIKRKNEAIGVLSVIAKHVKALLGKEHDVTPDGLRVAVTFKTDGRFSGVELGAKRLEAIAENVINHEEANDDYRIVLKNGEIIKSDEIFVRATFTIDSKGKSVDRDSAWTKLLEYYNTLKETGTLSS